MAKFKKFLKVSIALTLIFGVGAYFICLGIMPERTKEFTDIVIDYLNRPLGIAFGCTITLGGIIYFFIAYTSIGKKTLNYLKGIISETKAQSDNAIAKAKEYYELAKVEKEQAHVIANNLCAKIDELTDKLAKVCETIPNKKVNELGQEIVEQKDNYKVEINNEIAKVEQGVENYIEEKVDLKALQDKIDNLERLVAEYGEQATDNETKD